MSCKVHREKDSHEYSIRSIEERRGGCPKNENDVQKKAKRLREKVVERQERQTKTNIHNQKP